MNTVAALRKALSDFQSGEDGYIPGIGYVSDVAREMLAGDAPSYQETRPISTETLRLVWGTRAEINREKGYLVQGLDSLESAMRGAPYTELVLYSITDEQFECCIFTDSEVTEVIGVIGVKIPEKKK